jgi:phosphate-selective porin OprO/OprP
MHKGKQFKIGIITSLLISSGIFSAAPSAYADDSEELAKLRAQIQELDQKIRVLDRNNELAEEEAAARKKDAPIIKAGEDGFGFQSADGNFVLNLRGQLQSDARSTMDGFSSGNTSATAIGAADTYYLRQFRPTLSGTLFRNYEFQFMPDFGQGKTVIQDAWINANFLPWLQVEAGKQKTPFGIERLQGEADTKFIERGLPNDIVPNRDIGAQLHGNFANNTLTYAVGIFNGVLDGGSSDSYTSADTDNNGDKAVAARLFATPFKNEPGVLQGLGFGLATTYTDFVGSGTGVNATTAQTSTQSNLPSYKSALGQLSIFSYRSAAAGATNGAYASGRQLRWSPQAYYYYGPLGLIAEYVQVDQDVARAIPGFNHSDRLSNNAWQIVGSWLLTGEDAGYANPKPKRTFDLSAGSWGAWELVGRYGELNVDSKAFAPFGTGTAAARLARSFADPTAAISKASAWAGGINWYLNRNVKVSLDYEETHYNGGWTNAGGALLDRPTERILETQLQLGF